MASLSLAGRVVTAVSLAVQFVAMGFWLYRRRTATTGITRTTTAAAPHAVGSTVVARFRLQLSARAATLPARTYQGFSSAAVAIVRRRSVVLSRWVTVAQLPSAAIRSLLARKASRGPVCSLESRRHASATSVRLAGTTQATKAMVLFSVRMLCAGFGRVAQHLQLAALAVGLLVVRRLVVHRPRSTAAVRLCLTALVPAAAWHCRSSGSSRRRRRTGTII